ncbi:hypothetical protein F750_7071 (plasmid) [Streptomyces sp. PAMC 26508]|uniref:hypothetical protein n=1 Tax=Streptomyces sp. PAMC 26508 TaxID=1265601 RepID=UPI0002C6D23B|nr:hypothetical protein [Streptomyces sp. PAMC 26508]AGJ59495.1 hypothetical protein F750_7071 [Streptomyces sp. PAMC 26508]
MTLSHTAPEIPYSQWERLAELASVQEGARVTADHFRDAYLEAVERPSDHPHRGLIVCAPSLQELPTGAFAGPLEVDVAGIASLVFEGTYVDGDDWYFDGEVKLKVVGLVVWTATVHLSLANPSLNFRARAGVVEADITVGLADSCLRASGRIGYWTFSGWKEAKFDEILQCFGSRTVRGIHLGAGAEVSEFADFTGTCGENQGATSATGLKVNQKVRVNGEADLSSCVVGNNEACVYGIQLSRISHPLYSYSISVDAQGPRNAFGSFYLAFKDQTGDVYHLRVFDSRRNTHSVMFNSSNAPLTEFKWSNKGIKNW